jgi:hypothetical protein
MGEIGKCERKRKKMKDEIKIESKKVKDCKIWRA